jgi:hypothetical protein
LAARVTPKLLSKCLKLPDLIVGIPKMRSRKVLNIAAGLLAASSDVTSGFISLRVMPNVCARRTKRNNFTASSL